MWQTHDKKLYSFYGLWHYLDTELLNANLVHHVGTAKEVQRIIGRLHSTNFL
jgi:predicted extracellular nuclease